MIVDIQEITSILPVLFAVVGIGIVVGIAILILFLKRLDKLNLRIDDVVNTLVRFSEKTPDVKLANNMAKTADALSSSLVAHKHSLKELPSLVSGNVSSEVKTGIEPFQGELANLGNKVESSINHLADNLSDTHNEFLQALHTLNVDGELTEWIDSLRDTIKPLQQVSYSLNNHYETNAKLLSVSHDLVVQLAGLKEAAETSFSSISGVVRHWESKEDLHARHIESRIMSRLEEVQKSHEEVTRGISALQTSQNAMISVQKGLSESMQDATSSFDGLSTLNTSVQQQIQVLVEEQNRFKERLHKWQETIMTDSNNMQHSAKQFISDSQKSITKINEKMHEIVDKSTLMLASFHKTHQQSLNDLKQQHSIMAQTQTELTKEQRKTIQDIQNIIRQLPHRLLQITVVVMLFIQLLLLAALVWKS